MAVNIQQSIFSELADFIVSQPILEEIVSYRVSPILQQRIDDLLDKNREENLTFDERIEMEKILAISHLISLAKIKARLKLADE
jgi:hypothetical protein